MIASIRTGTFLGLLLLAVGLCGRAIVADAAADRPESALAREILDATGVRGGLVVHVGCGEGKLTAALRAGESYLVHGLERDAQNVEKARVYVRSLGLYGKVSVERWSGKRLPYTENLVNLLVVEDLADVPKDEILRVLAPQGVAYVKQGGTWTKTVKPRPAEIDEWTHYLHDETGNAVAHDAVVGPPRRYQWVAGPRWARSHDHLSSLSALVSSGGRIFYIVDEGPTASVAMAPKWTLVARDAFSGVHLWKRPVEPWEGHLRAFRSGPTELARRLVAVGDRVYVTLGYGKPLCALDAATGETVRTYDQTKNALEVIHHDGSLLVVVGDRPPDNTGGAAKPVDPKKFWLFWPIYEDKPPRKHLVAIDAATGATRWTRDDVDTAELMPTSLAAAGGRVFFQNATEILALEAATGKELWRGSRPINRRRPSWSAPTLVVYGDVVLCGDRAVDVTPPDLPDPSGPSQWVVDARGGLAPQGQIVAFAADTGRRLWESPCRECYNAPVDLFVIDNLVWSGNLVISKEPGITTGRDVKSGEVARTRPQDQTFFPIAMGHHRCHRNKATEKYLVLSRDGTELVDVATGKGDGNPWVRGSCQYGVMPCNGLIYAPSHSCACHIESKLNGFNALAPASATQAPPDDDARLERGPAYKQVPSAEAPVADPSDWPMLRHDSARSGRSSCAVAPELKPAWETGLPGGRLSSPVVAEGKVLVASIDAHAISALDARKGDLLWTFTAGGRIDSPPTIYRGAAVFGSADGWIYCLWATDGKLAWRFRAAPRDRRIVSYDQVESAWPVHGSVLVEDGIACAVAGRSAYLDGGMALLRLDAATGEKLSETPITEASLPDVLSSDGASIYLRHKRFSKEGVEQPGFVPHLYSPAGFLDDSWWHRTYWLIHAPMRSDWGGWPIAGGRVPAGRILAVDDATVYGFGRLNQYDRNGSHVGLGRMRYLLFASENPPKSDGPDAGQAQRRGKGPEAKGPTPKKPAQKGLPLNDVASRWAESVPVLVRAMVLGGETLWIAGPPDRFTRAPDDSTDPYASTSADALREQAAALAGQRGGLLWAVSTGDGKRAAEYRLPSPPVFDGMAAAGGRLYLVTQDGKVRCFGQDKAGE